MKFVHRFAYYLVGFTFGIFFLIFFFNQKDTRCNYMPQARVLNDLRSKPFYYSDQASAVLSENWMDTLDIKTSMKYGDVDFSRSNIPQQNGKLYVVEGKTKNNVLIELQLINYADKVVLDKIEKLKRK